MKNWGPSLTGKNLTVVIVVAGRIRHSPNPEEDKTPRGGFTNADVKSTLASAYFADASLKFGSSRVKIGAAFTLQSTFST